MKNYLFRIMSDIDEKYIEEASELTALKKNGSINVRKAALLCAVLSLVICALAALPFLRREKLTEYDFTSPEYEGFKIEGTTLVSYDGECGESLVIPDGIESIADYAFMNNKSSSELKVISLSSTVKKVANNAFAGCYALEELIADIENGSFVERDGLLMTSDGAAIVKYVGDPSIKSIEIPEGVKYIFAHAFQLTELEKVTFPDGLLYIGYNAFAGLGLCDIYLPESVEELAEGAFTGCHRAYEGSYPEGMKIGSHALQDTPFYMRAENGGVPTPKEDMFRYELPIAEAFQRSNGALITDQLLAIFEYYRSGKITTAKEAGYDIFCYAALTSAPPLPDGVTIPDETELDLSSLKIVEQEWGEKTNVEIIITLDGEYDMAVGYRLYDPWTPHYWSEVMWRVENIRFIPKDAAANADEVYGDWYIEYGFDREMNWYNRITFTNTDGRCITEDLYTSYEKFNLIPSQDGEHFIVEYTTGGKWYFFVEDLTGRHHLGFVSYDTTSTPYFPKADGDYLRGTARWNTDPETMEKWQIVAENVQGTFMMDCNLTEQIIRSNTLSGEDTYCDYDLIYIESDEKSSSEKTEETRTVIIGISDEEKTVDKVVAKPFAFEFPTEWSYGGYEVLRGETYSTERVRTFRFGFETNTDDAFELSYDYMYSSLGTYGYFEHTFKRKEIGGEYVKEYAYISKSEATYDGYAQTSFYVNILTADGRIIPMEFYSYKDCDGDPEVYFDNVIAPVVESTAPAEELLIVDMRFKYGEKSCFTLSLKDSFGKTVETVWELDLGFEEDKENNLSVEELANDWAKNYIEHISAAVYNGEYFLADGLRGVYRYKLIDNLWTLITE